MKTIDKYFEVRDSNNKLRFSSIFKVDAEFFLRRLLQRLKPGQKKPIVVTVAR